MLGKTISHYEILSEIGRGGMGVVYRARDTKLGREVAIKFLPPHLSADPEAVKRFVHEARAASALNHSAIGVIHEIDETEDGQTFIVMALYEGGTLRERIDSGPMTAGEAVAVASQIASGLAAAHEKGIVHRDIKPQNILLTKDGEAKIIDFGLAKLAGRTRLTRDGGTLGTAAYMSPEQARGEEVDHRSDIFSLGAVLYEMLAGETPFKGEHEAALLYGVVHEEPELLPDEVTAAHPGLQEIVDRALAKDPGDRYQRAEEFRSSLRPPTGEIGPISAASGRPARTPGKPLREKIYATLGIVAAAAIVLYLGYMFIPRDRARADRRSIVVLPFRIIVTEPGYEWFGDGMREAITGHLTKVEALKVISNASADKFGDKDLTPGEIARELGVATVLEASVQQTGGRMHLMVRLIDSGTDDYIWAEDYDRDMEDVFAVQSDIALKIADKLRAALSAEVEGRIEAKPTGNIEAYKLLMKGRELWNKGTHEDRLAAVALYGQAVEADPDYADAYAELSFATLMSTLYAYRSPREMIPKAREYALKALELDPDNASANLAMASIRGHFEWDLDEADSLYRRVIELDPGDADSHFGRGWNLMFMMRFDEAVSEYRKGLELNPLSVAHQQNMGEMLYYARRYDESIEESLRAIEMNPNHPQSHMFLGAAYHAKGMEREAITALDREQEMSGGKKPEVENWIGPAFVMAGERDKARTVLNHLHEMSRERWVSPYVIATIHIALGEVDQGFVWLGKALEEQDSRMAYVRLHPAYDSVRQDPRYIDILNRTGLAE